jgi:hypothetical protein
MYLNRTYIRGGAHTPQASFEDTIAGIYRGYLKSPVKALNLHNFQRFWEATIGFAHERIFLAITGLGLVSSTKDAVQAYGGAAASCAPLHS